MLIAQCGSQVNLTYFKKNRFRAKNIYSRNALIAKIHGTSNSMFLFPQSIKLNAAIFQSPGQKEKIACAMWL